MAKRTNTFHRVASMAVSTSADSRLSRRAVLAFGANRCPRSADMARGSSTFDGRTGLTKLAASRLSRSAVLANRANTFYQLTRLTNMASRSGSVSWLPRIAILAGRTIAFGSLARRANLAGTSSGINAAIMARKPGSNRCLARTARLAGGADVVSSLVWISGLASRTSFLHWLFGTPNVAYGSNCHPGRARITAMGTRTNSFDRFSRIAGLAIWASATCWLANMASGKCSVCWFNHTDWVTGLDSRTDPGFGVALGKWTGPSPEWPNLAT